jgi:hypothetical protein
MNWDAPQHDAKLPAALCAEFRLAVGRTTDISPRVLCAISAA